MLSNQSFLRHLFCWPFKNRKYKTWFLSSRNSQPKLRCEMRFYENLHNIWHSILQRAQRGYGGLCLSWERNKLLSCEVEIYPEVGFLSSNSSSIFSNFSPSLETDLSLSHLKNEQKTFFLKPFPILTDFFTLRFLERIFFICCSTPSTNIRFLWHPDKASIRVIPLQ